MTLVGSVELRLVWTGSPGALHVGAALVGWQEAKWVWAGTVLWLFMQRVPWQAAEAGASQGVPECSAHGASVAKAVAAWGALHRGALVGLLQLN